MSDSDDDDLPSVRKIIARSRSTIDLTLDDDDDSVNDKNVIEVSWLRITRTARHSVTLIPPFDRPRPTYRPTPPTSHHPHCKRHPHIPPTTTQCRPQRPRLLGRYFLGRMSLRGHPCITNSNCILPRLFITKLLIRLTLAQTAGGPLRPSLHQIKSEFSPSNCPKFHPRFWKRQASTGVVLLFAIVLMIHLLWRWTTCRARIRPRLSPASMVPARLTSQSLDRPSRPSP